MTKSLKIKVYSLDNKEIEDMSLSEKVFGVEIKKNIVAKLVNFQLARKRQGSHKVKERNEIVGSNAKIYRQKGTGRARHGSKKVVQFKGGGVVHGPKVRSHEFKLPSKIKKQAMRIILTSKLKEGSLKVVDKLEIKNIKTKEALKKITKLGLKSAVFIDGNEINKNFSLSIRNLKNYDILPFRGINAVQVLKRQHVVMSKNGLEKIEKHLG